MYSKAEQRISQYVSILMEKSYIDITKDRFSQWGYATRTEDGDENVPFLSYEPITFPFAYGQGWTNWWFSSKFDLTGLEGEVFLELFTETDTMVYIDGMPSAATNVFHKLVYAKPFIGGMHTLHLEAWDGHAYPGYHPYEKQRVLTTVAVKKDSYPLVFSKPRILLRDNEVFTLSYDVATLSDAAKCMDKQDYAYQYLMQKLHKALIKIDIEEDDHNLFLSQVRNASLIVKELLSAHNGTIAPSVISVGNAHLDNAWLWPVKETIRKAARTCLNMTGFASRYPEFNFLFTQPYQMRELKKRYPSVFEKVYTAYKNGQWEPNGVTFVEPDGNLPSGESLIRQCIKGRSLTAELFDGYEGDTCWLPDSFGYSAVLPQIFSGCGVKYFVTSKLSWNDTTRFPYDIFVWEGPDGSKIQCHMIQGAYEGTNMPSDIYNAYKKVQDKSIQGFLIRSVGEGDGGGGTMESDLEYMRREKDLQGIPKNSWSTLSSALHSVFDNQDDLPVYRGELYLELHRGTYTGQARIKKYNRMLEGLLHTADYIVSMRYAKGFDVSDDLKKINEAWEIVLLNQFHDVLPGSSIRRVNEEAEENYEKALSILKSVIRDNGLKTLNTSMFCYPLIDGTNLLPYSTVINKSVMDLPWGSVTIDDNARIISAIADGREIVPSGKALNTLIFGEDYPLKWDAWDIEKDSMSKLTPVSNPLTVEKSEDDFSMRIHVTYKLSKTSTLAQTIIVYKAFARIDFETEVEWHESHRMLRALFPITIKSNHANFASTFGYIERSTHHDYPEAGAMFEMPGHEWASLGDSGLTVAIASDSKYGYGVNVSELSLSLLRAGKAPDPIADQGHHSFSYSFIVTDKGLPRIMAHAAALNIPLTSSQESKPLCSVSCDSSVVVETVKVAENGKSIIIRLRETEGKEERVKLSLSSYLDSSAIVRTDMLERDCKDDDPFKFKAFEIKTYRVLRLPQ